MFVRAACVGLQCDGSSLEENEAHMHVHWLRDLKYGRMKGRWMCTDTFNMTGSFKIRVAFRISVKGFPCMYVWSYIYLIFHSCVLIPKGSRRRRQHPIRRESFIAASCFSPSTNLFHYHQHGDNTSCTIVLPEPPTHRPHIASNDPTPVDIAKQRAHCTLSCLCICPAIRPC